MSPSAEVLDSGSPLRAAGRSGRWARHPPAATKRMISGASLVLGGTIVGQVSGFVFNAVGAHALGPANYGVLAASMALLSFVAPLLAALQAVASREATSLAARKEHRKIRPMLCHYGLWVTGGSLALGVAAGAASSWIAGLFHLGSPWIVVIVGAIVPCYMMNHLLGGLLQGIERFARFASESIIEGLTKAIIGILAMGLLWRSAVSGMVAVAASCSVGLVAYLLLTLPILRHGAFSPIEDPGPDRAVEVTWGRGAHRRKPRAGVPGVVRYSVTALVTYGLLAFMLSSDTLIAKHYLSNQQAGLYAGISLAGKISYFAASSLFVVAFPIFSRHHDQGLSSAKWILAAVGVVGATAGVVVGMFTVEPGWVVIPLLGDRYRAAEGYVPWMAAIFGLYALGFLVSIYLLARKRQGIIGVLAAALVVQFAGFFAFHSSMSRIMADLAVAFGVMVIGGALLVLLGGESEDTTSSRDIVTVAECTGELADAAAVSPAGDVNFPRPRQPGDWQEHIVSEVARRVGPAPVLLAGSRALGTAHAGSDFDVVVVLPLLRIPRAAGRLAEAAEQLSAALGASVSVNPVPEFRMRRPGGSLFVRKLQAEAVVLVAPLGWSLRREPLTGLTKFAASSALLSAVRSLLETFDTSVMSGSPAPARADDALRKASLHVAQVKLLRSGCYASDLDTALARLRTIHASGSHEVSAAELSAMLTASLVAVDPVEGFMRLRQCILGQLAEIDVAPLHLSTAKSLVRNAQYAALARLRGRKRWRVALRLAPVEGALATTQLMLLRALDPGSRDGFDAIQLRLAREAFPVPIRAADRLRWEDIRDLALAEWLDAHPLVGVLA